MEKEHKCPHCGQIFDSHEEFERHKGVHTEKEEDQ